MSRIDAIAARCARIAEARAFTYAISAVIVANAVVLGLQTYPAVTGDAGALLNTLDGVFLGVFVVELAIRMLAHARHPLGFFRSGWNVFDFVVIVGSLLPGLRENTTLLRLLRLARIVRLVRFLPDLRVMITAVGRSVPGVASLAVLTVLLLYVYGIVGWLIFADHDPAGYGNVGDAMLTLFVLLSLENLPDQIEMGLEVSRLTLIYFISYVLVAAFLLFNMLIGVVLSSFEEAQEIEFRRTQDERRAAAAATDDETDDRHVALLDHVHELRGALERIESEAQALVADGERRRGG